MSKKLIGVLLAVLGLTTVGCGSQSSVNKEEESEITITLDDNSTSEVISSSEINQIVEGQLVQIDISQIEMDSYSIRIKTQAKNKTDKPNIVQVRNLEVDGLMVETDTIYSTEVNGGARAINDIEIYNNDGKLDHYEEDVTMIKNVKGKFIVLDPETFETFEEIEFEINK